MSEKRKYVLLIEERNDGLCQEDVYGDFYRYEVTKMMMIHKGFAAREKGGFY